MLPSGNDLRIANWNGSSFVDIDREIIDMNTSSTQVWFKTQADISASGSDNNYYMYYGNPSAVNPPADKSNVYDFWDDFDDGSLDPAWNFSQIGTASGSYSESGTVVILNATNSGDLWSTSDNILFLSISRSYDVLVESYTSSWGGSHGTWSKMGGVQLRESLNANSKNRIMSPVYSATGATNSFRLSTGGGTSEQTTATQSGYNRLSRIEGTSRAWYSANGTSWTELGSQISFSGGLSDPVRLGIHLAGQSSSSHWVEVDWFKVRKYVDPEPSVSLGLEEYGQSDKCVKISIDHNDVDSALSDFPVLVYLSNSSGRNDDDVSFIFDELQSDANRKKIAVTTSDGITQCYVEIERWDTANEQAWLWVNVPTISNTSDTDLYLYYDSDRAENVDYVDDTNVGNSANVWESNFKAVLHLNQTPSGQADEIKDSTSYANHGTTEGSMNSTNLVDTEIGKGLEFDDVDDLIRIINSTSLSFNKSSGTCELWINWDNASDGDSQIVMSSSNRFTAGTQDGFEWASQGSGNHFFYPWGGDGSDYNLGPNPFTNEIWHHLVVTYLYATKEVKIYVDAINMNFTTENVPTYWTQLANTSDWLWGGNPDRSTRYFDGFFDEIRIHSEVRSDVWIKASYESGRDHLLDFGSEEISPQNHDYVLRVNNTGTDAWQIRLKKYADSNINRMQDCTIYFHNSTDGTSSQIVIETGAFVNETGSWYDLGSFETIYIAMIVDTNSTGTSYINTYLEIRITGTTTFLQYMVTFEIT